VRVDIRGETQHPEGPADELDGDYEEGEWVANAETGEMEWHAADGTVLTQKDWNEQAASAAQQTAEVADADTAAADDAEAAPAAEAEAASADSTENQGEGDADTE
jgi:N utilization substance protein A